MFFLVIYCIIGPKVEFKHCMQCNLCVRVERFDTHKCTDSKVGCGVCLQYLVYLNSVITISFMITKDISESTTQITSQECGHLVHTKCKLANPSYQCIVCSGKNDNGRKLYYMDATLTHYSIRLARTTIRWRMENSTS